MQRRSPAYILPFIQDREMRPQNPGTCNINMRNADRHCLPRWRLSYERSRARRRHFSNTTEGSTRLSQRRLSRGDYRIISLRWTAQNIGSLGLQEHGMALAILQHKSTYCAAAALHNHGRALSTWCSVAILDEMNSFAARILAHCCKCEALHVLIFGFGLTFKKSVVVGWYCEIVIIPGVSWIQDHITSG